MARVNLEDQLFGQSRLKRFARLLGYPEQMALGILGFLWHDSQEYSVVEASGEEIAEWCRLEELQDFEDLHGDRIMTKTESLLNALLASRFITEVGPNTYHIHGNERQVEALDGYRLGTEERKRISSLGGKARAEKASRNTSGKFESGPADTQPELPAGIQPDEPAAAGPAASRNSIQFNAIQSNAKQCNSEEGDYESAAADRPSPDLLQLWNQNRGILSEAKQLNDERKRHWRVRWKDKPDEAYWISAIQRLAASAFANGENDRGWIANLDFLLRPGSHVKIMEGQYDTRPGVRRKTNSELVTDANIELFEKVQRGEA